MGEKIRSSAAHAVASPQKPESEGLDDFASYYPASKKPPKLPAGQPTVDTFNEPQMQALHRAYWAAPPSASLGEMIKLALKDPAFAKRKDVEERQVGRLFAKMEGSFPWGWRSRALAATSHVLIDALLRAPEGTAVTKICEQLCKADKNFPTFAAFKNAARGVWVSEPKRFPFASKLEKSSSGYKIEARGEAPDVRKDHLDRFVINEALAQAVADLGADPSIRFDWTLDDFVAFADEKLGGGFSRSTFNTVRDRFSKVVPSFTDIRGDASRRLAEIIRGLYDSGVTGTDDIMVALHKKHGYPLWKTPMLTYLRQQHPDLIPDFKAVKAEAAYAEARKLLDVIKDNPDKNYREAGATIGLAGQRVHELVVLIHRRWEDELPTQYKAPSYTLADRKLLQRAVDDAPLNATMADVLRILETEAPAFIEKHPFAGPTSFYASLIKVLDIDSWHDLQRQRFADAFADVAHRSPKGTSLTDIVEYLQDEYSGAYSRSAVLKHIAHWKEHPKKFPQIHKLKDKEGVFPWERSKVKLSESLAKRVAQEIKESEGKTLRQIVGQLHKDKSFTLQYPTFEVQQIHNLRARYPKIVPFVDDLKVHGSKARRKAWAAEYSKLTKQVYAEASKVEDPSGLTIAYLARKMGVKPHRVLHAVRREPAFFPWYRERPSGEIDLYLATKVGHELEIAPLGTQLRDIFKKLKADKDFNEYYPSFNYHSISRLRERYPDLVPHWYNRDAILRSKLLVDGLLTAKKGTSFKEVVESLEEQYPGQFAGRWSDPSYAKAIWASNPALYPFVKDLGKKFEGHGKPPAKEAETAGELATRLSKLERITETLPLLDTLGDTINKEYFANYEFLCIQHLLGPQVALFEKMREKGMKPSRTTIVGIPYSVSDAVADTLNDKGWDVRVPPLDLESWYLEVKKAMEERIESSKKSGRKIVVVDDGGLAAMMFDKYPSLAAEAHRFRIVEQTTRGITVADGVKLNSPVVNVAQSWGKFVEGPMIGDIVAEKLISRLAGIDVKNIKGKHVGVIGAGTIGLPLAEYLRNLGAIVTIRDIGADGQKHAKKADFDVELDDKKFFSKQDIIIGATGHQSMTAKHLEYLKSGCIIGSASSKLVEIDVDFLAQNSKGKKPPEVIDAETFPPTVRYTLKDGRKIDLIARGFPLNFDGDVESVASEKIQLTMGLLFIGAIQAANSVDAAGVRRLNPKAQLALLDAFEEIGALKASGPEVAEALELAKARLKQMAEKRGAADRRHGVTS